MFLLWGVPASARLYLLITKDAVLGWFWLSTADENFAYFVFIPTHH
jgi:hypothetical protein